jgi:hypothetical protein
MPADGPIVSAVTAALEDAPLLPRDVVAVALAKRYAALLDDAERLAEMAGLIEPETDTQARKLASLEIAVDAQSIASDLGPKLLAVLSSLGMTPAGRGVKGGGAQGGATPVTSRLDELRNRRERRTG